MHIVVYMTAAATLRRRPDSNIRVRDVLVQARHGRQEIDNLIASTAGERSVLPNEAVYVRGSPGYIAVNWQYRRVYRPIRDILHRRGGLGWDRSHAGTTEFEKKRCRSRQESCISVTSRMLLTIFLTLTLFLLVSANTEIVNFEASGTALSFENDWLVRPILINIQLTRNQGHFEPKWFGNALDTPPSTRWHPLPLDMLNCIM